MRGVDYDHKHKDKDKDKDRIEQSAEGGDTMTTEYFYAQLRHNYQYYL